MNQTLLDRIRALNKKFTNKLLIHLCGRNFGHFAILTHTGRKSGKLYRIPIMAEPFQGGFVIEMTYGPETDWYKNVMAKGACSLYWKHKDYPLTNPRLIDPETGRQAFPAVIRLGIKLMRMRYFLQLDSQPE
jgi:deazaflavin-dependent oxidoreductase (nitroreductase family)